MTNLPPSPYQGVLNLNASAIIDAPIEKVWDLLTNFQSYSEWWTKKPLPDQTPHEGAYLLMEVHIPPTEDRKHKPTSRPLEKITAVDHGSYRIAWVNLLPQWLLHAERWQALSVVEDGKTLYETREVMSGPAAWIVRWFLGADLQKGFEAVAEGLKKRAEQLQQ
ncbi:hypothetical protein WOLCODRAFT_132673 [Wolfiporia cocos MD-104 SS10]|uniref:SRPBCC domain-containing protein n=1 Tax=Wolfiporia cocos (strain MD-104) TaxID=742152 RepID=A0A2H3K284_WOLCO|nr:hypothetical protein WOLCODRAFT_132673 [Wolfiporia cocos MD-104 SS10]